MKHLTPLVALLLTSPLIASEKEPTKIHITLYGDANATTTGSRVPVSAKDNPYTVETIDKSAVIDTSSLRIEDLADSVPGITQAITQGGFNTALTIRGFNTGERLFTNGHLDNTRYYVRDFATLDRVEVLKGHSAILYGSGAPGGTLNYIPKSAQNHKKNSVSATLGNLGLRRVTLDHGHAFGADGNHRYRLVAVAQDARHFYENAQNDRYVIAPSVLWQLGPNDTLRADLELAHANAPLLFGTVYRRGEILYDRSYIDPRAYAKRDHTNLRLYWNRMLSSSTRLTTTFARYKTRRDDLHIGFFFKLDEDTLRGYYREVDDDYTQYLVRSELVSSFGEDDTHHAILGIESNRNSGAITAYRIIDFTLDIDDPEFTTDFSELSGRNRAFTITNKEHALYGMGNYQLSDQLTLHFGARYSQFDTTFRESSKTTLTDQSTLSSSLAFNYRPQEQLAFYGSYSESFEPNTGRDRNDQFFDPKESSQIELGLRAKAPDGNHAVAISTYQITQGNLLTADPIDRDFRILAGEQRHRGLELVSKHVLSQALTLKLGYAYLDAKVTKNNDGREGNTPPNAPKHSGVIGISYTPLGSSALRLNANLVAVGKRQGDLRNSFNVPGYGRLDLGARYTKRDLTYVLHVTNALDKDYIAASYLQDDLYRGSPRRLMVSVSRVF